MVIRNPKKASSFRSPRERAKEQNNKETKKIVTSAIINGKIEHFVPGTVPITYITSGSPRHSPMTSVISPTLWMRKCLSNLLKAGGAQLRALPQNHRASACSCIHLPAPLCSPV